MFGLLCLKSNFLEDIKKKDGVQRKGIICTKQYNNNREEQTNALKRQKQKTDLNFKLICNIRTWTNKAFKSQKLRKLIKRLIY